MLNLGDIVSNNKSSSERNDWPFRMLIIEPSDSGKTICILLIKYIYTLKT